MSIRTTKKRSVVTYTWCFILDSIAAHQANKDMSIECYSGFRMIYRFIVESFYFIILFFVFLFFGVWFVLTLIGSDRDPTQHHCIYIFYNMSIFSTHGQKMRTKQI